MRLSKLSQPPAANLREIRRKLSKPRLHGVAWANRGTLGRHRPTNAEVRVVPQKPLLVRRAVDVGYGVPDFGIRGERAKTVRKSFRDPKLCIRFRRKLDRNVFPIRGRRSPDIDSNIQDCTANTTDELALGSRSNLMQPPYRSDRPRKRLVMLNKRDIADVRLKEIATEKLDEMTSAVTMTLRGDLDDPGNMTFFEDHLRRLPIDGQHGS
jgi:hypothetical protein